MRTGARAEGPLTLDNYVQFFSDTRQLSTIWTTFQVSLPVTMLTIAVSLPLAYFMRRGIKFEKMITIILILPITLGTVMVAQAMLNYFGPKGWFNLVLRGLGLIQQPIRLTHNWAGVEIALFMHGFPFVFLMILGYMSGISPDLERASRMLGAKPWQTFWRVIFPLTLPGAAIAFCLNFVANFSVFPSAMLVGEPNVATRVMSIAAYQTAFEQYNQPMGTAIALVMGVVELIVVGAVLWLRNRMARGATLGGGKGA
jgi:putative spermidine/putrescine transport system permease protein